MRFLRFSLTQLINHIHFGQNAKVEKMYSGGSEFLSSVLHIIYRFAYSLKNYI